jgi:acyl-CoA synthetase (NDP forming)
MPGDAHGFASLTSIMEPASVAIIGASDTPGRIGGRSLAYMLEQPFAGRLYPVNPHRTHVQGVPAYASIAALPEIPDAAIIALPAELVPGAVDDLIAKGTRSAIIFSAGFAETGAPGAARQAALAGRARAAGLRLLGPNSLGLINTRRNFWGTFSAALGVGWPVQGRLGIASQSGAYGAHMLTLAVARGLGISSFVTTGNEADITATDAIGWMAQDDGTDVIVAYLEGISDGARLVAALDIARAARKPVIVMKAGRSALGSRAAQSHTASLAGNDAVVDAVLRIHGALRIENAEQALDFAEAALLRNYPVGNTLGVLTVSGGAGILIADEAERLHLPLPPLPEQTQKDLLGLLSFAATRNPVDCTAQAFADIHLIGDFGTRLVADGGYGSLLIFLSYVGGQRSSFPALREQLGRIRAAGAGRRGAPDCLYAAAIIAPPDIVAQYREDGFLVYEEPARAVAALAAMGRLGDGFARPRLRPVVERPEIAVRPLAATPNEAECKAIFAEAGLAVPEERVVTSAADAAAAAAAIGLPVVMKILSPEILHKTEIGGVLLGVRRAEDAGAGFTTLMARAAAARPQARLDGVLVARQIENGVECMMGIQRDPVFGPIAVFGLGGIFVEILNDAVLHPCPFDEATAMAMIRGIRGLPVLEGARGQGGADLSSLARMLSRLSYLAVGLGSNLVSIDINPVIATPQGAWAADGVIEIDS